MPSGRRGGRVWVYGPDGDFKAQYESAADCVRAMGISRSALDHAIKSGDPNRKTGLCFDYEFIPKGGRA